MAFLLLVCGMKPVSRCASYRASGFSSSYSIFSSCAAHSACSNVSATTIATCCPLYPITGSSRGRASPEGGFVGWAMPFGWFSWVITASTPGARSAAFESMRRMRPLAIVALTISPRAWFGIANSKANFAPPVTFSRPSTRSIGFPTAFSPVLPSCTTIPGLRTPKAMVPAENG